MRTRSCNVVRATLVACGTIGLMVSLAGAQTVSNKNPKQAQQAASKQQAVPTQSHGVPSQPGARTRDRALAAKGVDQKNAGAKRTETKADSQNVRAAKRTPGNNAAGGGVILRGPGTGFLGTCSPVPYPVGDPEGTYAFDTSIGGVSGHTPSCGASGTIDVWMSYTPTVSGLATVTTCGGSVGDTILSVYTDCPVDFGGVEIVCNDDDCGIDVQSTVTFPVNPGEFYVIRIAGFNDAVVSGNMTISVDAAPPPNNDVCAVDVPEVFVGVPYAGTTAGASNSWTSSDPGACGAAIPGSGGLNDVWVRFTAPADDNYVFSLCGSGYDTQISVFSGCPADFDDSLRLTCNDDSCGLQSQTTPLALTMGQEVFVRIAGWNGATGNFTLNITSTGSLPQGDDCSDPWIASLGLNAFDTTGFTTTVTGCTGSNDGWFAYTADADGTLLVETCGLAGFDTTLGAYDACGVAPAIACNDDACAPQSRITFSVTNGVTYYIRIAGFGGATGAGQISLEYLVPPANDLCAVDSPEIFLDTPVAGTTIGAGTEASGFPVECSPFGSEGVNDVFYRFIAPADGCYDFSTCGSPDDTHLVIFDACGGNVLACNDDACGFQSTVSGLSLANGQTVWVRVAAWSAADAAAFTLVVTGTTPVDCADCPVAATIVEAEPAGCGVLGDDYNGGCNSFTFPPPTVPVVLGDVICGTGAYDGTTRDTDFYSFTLADTTEVRLSVTAEFPVLIAFIVDDQCLTWDTAPVIPAFLNVAACTEGSITATLAAGNYYAFVAPQFATPFSCEPTACAPTGFRYVATIETPAPSGACCIANVCSIDTEANCVGNGGTYQGDGTSCDGSITGGTVSTSSPNALIPDNDPVGVSDTLTGSGGVISDLLVSLEIAHTWQGDVTVTLTHVNSGTTRNLISRPGSDGVTVGFGTDNFGSPGNPFTLFDGAVETYDTPQVPAGIADVSGLWKPDLGPLSDFNGLDANSDWTLTVTDSFAADTGTLITWSIIVNPTIDSPCSGPQFCPADWCQDGEKSVSDIFCFLADWFGDLNGAREFGGTPGVPAIFAYLAVWFATPNGPCVP